MKRTLIGFLIVGLIPFGISSKAIAAGNSRADCVNPILASYYPLGYDPQLGKYLSEAERNNLDPAVDIGISYRGLCNFLPSDIKLQQFKFTLKIDGYRNGVDIPLWKSFDLYTMGADLLFRVPGISPGNYTGTLLVQDVSTTGFGRREIKLDQFIKVYSSIPSPSIAPAKPTSSFRSLYNTDTVWVVGNTVKIYTCWSTQVKSLKLQVKVRGKWISKVSAKFGKDATLCSGKHPWVAKYSWSVDEYGEIPRTGERSRNLIVREYAAGLKDINAVSRVIYANNADRLQDGLDLLGEDLDLNLR